MRKFFIHIGTHKTGTTLIQTLLREQRDQLAKRGFMYPEAGLIPEHNGHHNIAWEVAADPRFRKDMGTVEQLLQEVSSTDRNVVISSEDFSSTLARPDCLALFFDRIEENDFEINIIVYLRNQADYIRSIYLELIKHGYSTPFEPFLNLLLEQNLIQSGGCDQKWDLRYSEWLQRIPKNDRRKMFVRSYDSAKSQSLILDFLSVLGLTATDILVDPKRRINEVWPLGAIVAQFYRNGLKRDLTPEEAELGVWLEKELLGKSLSLRQESILRINASFYTSNEELRRQFGVQFFQERPPAGAALKMDANNVLPLEDVFSVSMAQLLPIVIEYYAFHIARQSPNFGPLERVSAYVCELTSERDKAVQNFEQCQRSLDEAVELHSRLSRDCAWCLTVRQWLTTTSQLIRSLAN